MAKKRPSLSVCMIVKNEERNLPRVLGSIEGLADEVIVVDTGSTDDSVKTALSYGAQVYHFSWCDDFSAARNESLRHATKDYILWLDGDDELPKGEHHKIRNALAAKPGHAWYLRLRNVEALKQTEAVQLRMFPNRRNVRFEGRVHEQVYSVIKSLRIPLAFCNAVVNHYGYYDPGQTQEKLLRNKTLLEREIADDPRNPFALFFLSRSLKGLNEIEEAHRCLDELLKLADGEEKIHEFDIVKIGLVDKAELLCRQGRAEEALNLLERWLKIVKGDTKIVTLTLGDLYFQRGDYEAAYRMLRPLMDEKFNDLVIPLDLTVTRSKLTHQVGISGLFIKDYASARKAFERYTALNPHDPQGYHYLALTYERKGTLNMAVTTCREAIRTIGEDPFLRKRLFLLLVDTGDLAGAEAELSLLEDSDEDVEIISARLLLGCLKMDAGAIQENYLRLQKALFMPLRPFPEDYGRVGEKLAFLNEAKARDLFDRAIANLLKINGTGNEKPTQVFRRP